MRYNPARMMKWIYLFLGGGAGTIARYVFSGLVYQGLGPKFPFGTLAVNLSGCFLIGFFAVLIEEKFLFSPEVRLLIAVGFLGGFTTFSTFIFETANLIRDGQTIAAFVNVLASVCAGFLAFRLGVLLAEII